MRDVALLRNWRLVVPVGVGLACIVAGGLVAAATAHAPTQPASWAAAYLVLVGGVATLGLTLGRALLSPGRPSDTSVVSEVAAWLVGNALVLVGTLTDLSWVVDIGGALLVIALALVALAVRHGSGPRPVRVVFTALVVLLLVSIPVGLVLAQIRS